MILLGAIALMCVGGLFYLSTPPELSTTQPVESTTQQPSEGGSQSGETGQTPGEAALLAQDTPQGATGPVATTANEAVNNAATDAATLGLAGQIVALLGTIAGAAVAGIAGLLVGPGRTDQGSNTDPRPTPGAGQ